jgi:hypothetical protein
VEGLVGIEAGDRIRINPDGRGHNYLVEDVEALRSGTVRLKLDVTSVLGRSPIASVDGGRVDLRYAIPARTGNLVGTRLEAESDGVWAAITGAANPVRESTVLITDGEPASGNVSRVLWEDEWVRVVDYVVGDAIAYEPVREAG